MSSADVQIKHHKKFAQFCGIIFLDHRDVTTKIVVFKGVARFSFAFPVVCVPALLLRC